jgi:hypothetical protein
MLVSLVNLIEMASAVSSLARSILNRTIVLEEPCAPRRFLPPNLGYKLLSP